MILREGLKPWQVLRALFNAADRRGIRMSNGEAAELWRHGRRDLREGGAFFDYVQGRALKVVIPNDARPLDARLYDREHGKGAAQRALDRAARALHLEATLELLDIDDDEHQKGAVR